MKRGFAGICPLSHPPREGPVGGCKKGSPKASVTQEEVLAEVDFVLVMTVEPGFGGQEFIPSSLDKIGRLRRMLTDRGLDRVKIAVDGGIHVQTAAAVIRAGATVLVVGTAIFNEAASVADNLNKLHASIAASI